MKIANFDKVAEKMKLLDKYRGLYSDIVRQPYVDVMASRDYKITSISIAPDSKHEAAQIAREFITKLQIFYCHQIEKITEEIEAL